jgi:N,N'-diacetyllegionaminate synthase
MENPMNNLVHIIAEAGTNHSGSVANGKRLIDLAVRAKADTVKFQIIDPDHLYLPGQYEFGHYEIDKVRAMRKRLMLTDAQYRELAEYARTAGVLFTASVFDLHGLDFLAGLRPPYIKIASTDLNNVRFLRQVAEKGIRIILSTGMSSLGDIEHSVTEILRTGFRDLVLMHCVSAYPAKLEEINLPFIDTLRSAFGFPVALSDHTESSIAACLALTKGVVYIEKHYTYDRNSEGFDHAYACEGDAFIQYTADIRAAEQALAVPPAKLGERELYVRKRARRSLYAARDLKTGEAIRDTDVLVRRPQSTMAADKIDEVVGRRLSQDMAQYAPFKPEFLTK